MISLTPIQMKLAGVALGVLIIAIAVFYVRHLKTDLQAAREKVTELQVKLKVQNDAVMSLKAEADAALVKHQQELEKAQSDLEAAKAQANVTYKTPPANPHDLCGSALKLMNGAK